jgi:hypothetical protein
MEIRVAVSLLGLAISFSLPTLTQQAKTSPAPTATATAQQKDTVDPQLAQLIRLLAVKFDEAFNNGDAAALAAFYMDDAVPNTLEATILPSWSVKVTLGRSEKVHSIRPRRINWAVSRKKNTEMDRGHWPRLKR